MKTIPYFKLLILCAGLILSQSCNKSIDFQTLDGKAYQMSDFKGKWLLLNFWAEWCAPCLKEIPELNRLYLSENKEKFALIGISYDPLNNSKIKQIVKQWDIQYPVMATEPMPILPYKLPKSLPGNYIINPDGELVAKLVGQQTHESLSKLLKSLRKKRQLSQ